MVHGEKNEVKVWDEWGTEQNAEEVECWDTWETCNAKGIPKGLVMFLRSPVDAEKPGCGFPAPTTIQSYSWAALVTGKDFIGVARTGSGKTLAFLIPAFMWLRKNKKGKDKFDAIDTSVGPGILCLTPTRELCYQIYSDAEKFGNPVNISAACVYGGQKKWEQEQRLRENPDCVIATPGRLADFLRSRTVSLEMCRYLTLDEADRMLDMGFDSQVKEILDWMPEERQISMFTATWPREVRALADKYIQNPMQIQVGNTELEANRDITQHVVLADDWSKTEVLNGILKKVKGATIVFCNTKKKVKELAWELPNAVELHGDLDQRARDESLRKFREDEASVLVATDIASRGLDCRSCTTIVNYDAPNRCDEDYVHRIGRTGRAGDKGDAFTILTENDTAQAQAILTIMENGGMMPPEVLREMVHGRFNAGKRGTAKFRVGGANKAAADNDAADEWEQVEEAAEEAADEWETEEPAPAPPKKPPPIGKSTKPAQQTTPFRPTKRPATSEVAPTAKRANPTAVPGKTPDEVFEILKNPAGSELTSLHISDLRNFLKSNGLDSTGLKMELMERAMDFANDEP